jgi:hypothetical protein
MSKLPKFPVEGGCACDRVRYRLTAPPMNIYICHCTDCQTITTSAFVQGAFLAPEHLQITQGREELMEWQRIHTTTGKRPSQYSCRHCGVRIYSQSRPNIVTVRIGTLDDTSWLKPAGSIWMKSAQSWVILPDDILRYDEDGDYAAINAKWQAEWID